MTDNTHQTFPLVVPFQFSKNLYTFLSIEVTSVTHALVSMQTFSLDVMTLIVAVTLYVTNKELARKLFGIIDDNYMSFINCSLVCIKLFVRQILREMLFWGLLQRW